jgi:hypothetical protein
MLWKCCFLLSNLLEAKRTFIWTSDLPCCLRLLFQLEPAQLNISEPASSNRNAAYSQQRESRDEAEAISTAFKSTKHSHLELRDNTNDATWSLHHSGTFLPAPHGISRRKAPIHQTLPPVMRYD